MPMLVKYEFPSCNERNIVHFSCNSTALRNDIYVKVVPAAGDIRTGPNMRGYCPTGPNLVIEANS